MGSTTFRKQEKRRGTEPGAIEVVETSGSINKLEVYRRLEVREVWFFKPHQFEIYRLRGETYEQIEQSEVLPNLNLAVLAQYAVATPLEAALEFRQKIREMEG